MQFMLLLTGDEATSLKMSKEEGQAVMEAYAKYTQDLISAGVLLGGDALLPSATGARVAGTKGGKMNVTDGPFSEAKEVIGGYYIIDVKSRDEAIEWAKRCPGSQYGDRGAFIEVRQLMNIMAQQQQ